MYFAWLSVVHAFFCCVHFQFAVSDFSLYPNDSLTTSISVALSPACISAMERPLQCDSYLQSLADSDYYGSLDNSTIHDSVCNSACGSSLSSYRRSVLSACAADPQPWQGISPEWYGDVIWAAYNLTCLKDSETGSYCSDYVTNATSTLTGDMGISHLPVSQLCSPCVLALLKHAQSTPFSNYDDSVAGQWSTVQSACNIKWPVAAQPLSTNVTNLPGHVAANYSVSSQCISGNSYTVVSGDTCQLIAAKQGVATGTLIAINQLLPDCSDLQSGNPICLPYKCRAYLVQAGDTCYSIAESAELSYTALLSYNPTLNPSCTNLLSGLNICISVPGPIYTGTTIEGATGTKTMPYASTTATPPAGNIAKGTTRQCGKYYQVQSGDICQLVALRHGIALDLFLLINPSINAECSNLLLGLYYCVLPTLNWNATTSHAVTKTAATPSAAASPPAPTLDEISPNWLAQELISPNRGKKAGKGSIFE